MRQYPCRTWHTGNDGSEQYDGIYEQSTTTGTGTSKIAGPIIQSEGAVVIDAATGTVLYGKEPEYQILPSQYHKADDSAFSVGEQLGDTVTFSGTATENLESGAVS